MTPSFEDRFVPLADLAYKVADRLVGERAEAEDLAQEALCRAYLRWRRVAAYDEAWVARVTTNLAIGRWRRRRVATAAAAVRDPAERADGAGPGPDPVERLALVRALRSLPARQRSAVALRYLADLPEAEVAALLGCSPGAVKQHTHRGLAALRGRVRGLIDDEIDDDQREEASDVRTAR